MEFGRKLAYRGHKLKLDMFVRQSLLKSRKNFTSLGQVKIFSKNPKCHPTASPIATLTPQTTQRGHTYVIYDVPTYLSPGIYYDHWSGFQVENSQNLPAIVNKIFISSEDFSHETYLEKDMSFSLAPSSILSGSKEYLIFTLNSPSYLPFPKATFTFLSEQTVEIPLQVVQVSENPGFSEPVIYTTYWNHQDPITLVEAQVVGESGQISLGRYENKGYVLLDTEGFKEGLYKVILTVEAGETRTKYGPYSLRILQPEGFY